MTSIAHYKFEWVIYTSLSISSMVHCLSSGGRSYGNSFVDDNVAVGGRGGGGGGGGVK